MAKSFRNMNTKISEAKQTIKTASEIIEAGRQGFLEQGLLDGSITKENFLSIKEQILLPINVTNNPLLVLALNYDCNSKVGSWTNKAMNICTALPSEFLNEDGVGANDKFRKAFPSATKTGKKKHYTRIFKDELNVHTFTIFTGEKYEVTTYYVSDKEIQAFAEEIASLDLNTLTVLDIKNIQADLWFLFRAWQESAIDMTKDKDKQFGIAMDEVLGYIEVRTAVKFQDIKINHYDIKKAKYDKTVKADKIPSLWIDFAQYDEINKDFVETTLSGAQDKIRNKAEETLQVNADAYVNHANVSELAQFVSFAKEYPELAMTIMDLFRIIKDYNNTSKDEKKDGKKLTNRDYALLRAIAYNDARELGVDPSLVCAVGIGAAVSDGVYVDKRTGDIVVKEFDEKKASSQLYCVERLFGNIMVLEKGIMYGSDNAVDELYIKQEVDPKHVFTDVPNGRYNVANSDVTDADGNLIFDLIKRGLTGEVAVEDDGVFYLYNPLTEIYNAPAINALFINKTIEDGRCEDDKAVYFESVLKGQKTYTLEGNVVSIADEKVAFVDDDYASDNAEIEDITNWYGISGIRWDGEKPIQRSNKFLLLSYDTAEVEAYINSITEYIG